MDTAQAEHVLVFQVAAVAPAVHLDSQDVLSRFYIFRDIEFRVVIRPLAVSDFLSVHPKVHGAIDTVEMDKDFTSFPIVRDIEVAAVGTDRIRFVHDRISFLSLYERRVVAMRICDIRIDRRAVSVHFPIGWNRNFFPAGNVVVRFIEIGRTFGRLFHPVEFPVTVQQLVARRVRAKPGFAVVGRALQAFHGGEGNIGRMPRFLVDGKDGLVFPILVARSAQGFLVYFDVRPAQCPVLSGVGRIGNKLESRFSRLPVIADAEVQPVGYAGERVGVFAYFREFPELVHVGRPIVPLDNRTRFFRVVVVHAFVCERRTDLIDPIAGSRQLPYLRHAVLHTVVDEYLGSVVFAVLIVENQIVAAYDFVISVRIDLL